VAAAVSEASNFLLSAGKYCDMELSPHPGVRRKISALNATLDHLHMLKNEPGLSPASEAVCDQKISEVASWKAEIEQTPDCPLVQDMNKYMARATSAIAPKKSAQQTQIGSDRVLLSSTANGLTTQSVHAGARTGTKRKRFAPHG
jgi:hypothetical protein